MSRLGFVFACLFALAGPAPAASPDPKALAVPPAEASRARQLVERLGGDTFADREAAHDDLAKMGRLAYQALVDGVTAHPSAEVRFRCQELLPRASAAELKAKIETFLADAENKFEHDLPGWNQFRKITGNSAAARSVFTELLADPDNRAIVLACGGPPDALASLVVARKQELYQSRFNRAPVGVGVGVGVPTVARRDATAADIATIMFAETFTPNTAVARNIAATAVTNSPALMSAVSDGGEKAAAYKAVVARWVETRDDAVTMYQAMNLASNLGLNDPAVRVAAKLAAANGATPLYRTYGVLMIARLDAKQHLGVVEALFKDEVPVVNFVAAVGGRQREMPQVRDVALACALILTGQEPTDYGFTSQFGGASRFSYSNWSIEADKRDAAFAKWKAWRADHPDAGKPDGEKK